MIGDLRAYRCLYEPDQTRPWIVFGEHLNDRRAWVEIDRFHTNEEADTWIAQVQQRQTDSLIPRRRTPSIGA